MHLHTPGTAAETALFGGRMRCCCSTKCWQNSSDTPKLDEEDRSVLDRMLPAAGTLKLIQSFSPNDNKICTGIGGYPSNMIGGQGQSWHYLFMDTQTDKQQ